MVVIDSVDEFLMNHPELPLRYVREAFRRLDRKFRDNERVGLVVATRISLGADSPSPTALPPTGAPNLSRDRVGVVARRVGGNGLRNPVPPCVRRVQSPERP